EGYFVRGFGARALASTVAFAGAELPTFVFTERGLREALGQRQDWSARGIGRDLASAGLTLGALKAAGFGTTSLLQRIEGEGLTRSWLQTVSRPVLPQLGMFLGILGGHRLEEALGLRERVDGATSVTDALSTLLQFHVAGRLLEGGMGPEYARWQQELHARSE